jgi:chemotaxis protein CheD
MNSVVVGIGEYFVSNDPDDIIKTFALGSCVAVIMYDKVKKIAGLIHIALPFSEISDEKRRKLPGYFADTGIPILINLMKKKGALLNNVWIKMVGGANVLNTKYNFDIGIRNVLAVKKILWKNNLGIIAEDVGENRARTCMLYVGTGEVQISSQNQKWKI